MLAAVVVVYASNSTTTPIAPLLSDAIKISNPDGSHASRCRHES